MTRVQRTCEPFNLHFGSAAISAAAKNKNNNTAHKTKPYVLKKGLEWSATNKENELVASPSLASILTIFRLNRTPTHLNTKRSMMN